MKVTAAPPISVPSVRLSAVSVLGRLPADCLVANRVMGARVETAESRPCLGAAGVAAAFADSILTVSPLLACARLVKNALA